jgi:steroid 5-alpha reductase family enzyme
MMGVFPDFSGVGVDGDLRSVVGALLMIVLILAVAMLIICAVTWAIASSTGNYHTAGKARIGLFVALGAAILAGAAVTWINFLIQVGTRL